MGIYLSSPITTKVVENNTTCRYPYGAASMQGWRRSQEDAHNCLPEFDATTETALFAVYDGHGGAEVAKYCKRHLPGAIRSTLELYGADVRQALKVAFLRTDERLTEAEAIEEMCNAGMSTASTSVARSRQDEDEDAVLFNDCSGGTAGGTAGAPLTSTPDSRRLHRLAAAEHPTDASAALLAHREPVVDFGPDDDNGLNISTDGDDDYGKDATVTVLSDDVVPARALDDDDVLAAKALPSIGACTSIARHVPGFDSGCTSCIALIRGGGGGNAVAEIVVANAGDSRCVLSCGGYAEDMSCDHKPQNGDEYMRIRRAGGILTFGNRINGGLNVSRAIGDHNYKNRNLPQEHQMVTAMPDVTTRQVTNDCEFLVLACDGIWNSMSSQAVVDFVRERLVKKAYSKLSDICCQLFDVCLSPTPGGSEGGCDNMTCIIVLLTSDIQPGRRVPFGGAAIVESRSGSAKRETAYDEAAAAAATATPPPDDVVAATDVFGSKKDASPERDDTMAARDGGTSTERGDLDSSLRAEDSGANDGGYASPDSADAELTASSGAEYEATCTSSTQPPPSSPRASRMSASVPSASMATAAPTMSAASPSFTPATPPARIPPATPPPKPATMTPITRPRGTSPTTRPTAELAKAAPAARRLAGSPAADMRPAAAASVGQAQPTAALAPVAAGPAAGSPIFTSSAVAPASTPHGGCSTAHDPPPLGVAARELQRDGADQAAGQATVGPTISSGGSS